MRGAIYCLFGVAVAVTVAIIVSAKAHEDAPGRRVPGAGGHALTWVLAVLFGAHAALAFVDARRCRRRGYTWASRADWFSVACSTAMAVYFLVVSVGVR